MRLVIRDPERKDQEQLYKIVWQKNVVRFMRDWSENSPNPESFDGYVDWHQTQKDSIDCANEASCKVVERAGFELFEKRYPINHNQPNMESDCYYYYRKYRRENYN